FSGGQLVDGFAYNQRPTEITYCYQAEPAANDTAGISVLLWQWTGSSRNYIGGAKNLYPTVNNTMANGTLTIAYSNTLTPDSMAIYVASSYKFPGNGTSIRKGAQLGSKMYVDNIQFPASTVGLNESAKNELSLNVYPIPSNSNVYFEAGNNEATRIEIIDLTGKQINIIGFNNNKAKLDVSDYHSGIYFYSVKNTNGKTLKTGKFSVTH
ncbi:MAG: T9SS type A sorting domain-containing protein, partial [Flavobacteriales bacterium]|nr:T9SS type A sorting domain-containing protein [Flavobacteriales bacterium]